MGEFEGQESAGGPFGGADQGAVSTEPDSSEPDLPVEQNGPLARPKDPRSRLAWVAVMLFVLTATIGGLNLARATSFNAYDEAAHLDYTYKIVHGQLPFDGDLLGRYTLNEWACERQANLSPTALPPCGSEAPASRYGDLRFNYNGFHPPGYYLVTGLAAQVVSQLPGVSFFDAARAVSIIWVFLGLFALYLVLRYWRVRWQYALAAPVVMFSFPSVVATVATVTNDAPAWLCGAGALFVLGRVLIYRRTGWLLPVVLSLLIASTKSMSSLAICAVAVALAVWAIANLRSRGFRAVWPTLLVAGLIVASSGLIYVAWTLFQNSRAIPGWVNPLGDLSSRPLGGGLPFSAWLPSLFSGFRLGSTYYLDPPVAGAGFLAWSLIWALLLSMVCLVGLALYRRSDPEWWLTLSIIIGSLAYPLVVQVQSYITSSGTRYFPAPTTRYASTLIPLAVALVALLASRFGLRKCTLGALVVGLLVLFSGALGLA